MRRRPVLVAALVLACWSAALGYSPTSRAEQEVVRVGYVDPASNSAGSRSLTAFWSRMRDLGWIEGKNLVAERRSAGGRIDRLPELMAELVSSKVDVIVTYSTPAALAAKTATSTIPIVVATMGDPVGSGLAASLSHPGGNLTGLSVAWTDIASKWLELLQETVPRLSSVAVIADPSSSMSQGVVKELQAMASARGLKVQFLEVREPRSLDRIFKKARRDSQAIIVPADPLTWQYRAQIAALANQYRLPGMYPFLDFVDSGGLMMYGDDDVVRYRRAAEYVDKILRGTRPADLPIEQPSEFVFVVNLKTAKLLGLKIPDSVLLRASKVIR